MGNICSFEIQVDNDKIDRNKSWYLKKKKLPLKITENTEYKIVFYKGQYYWAG